MAGAFCCIFGMYSNKKTTNFMHEASVSRNFQKNVVKRRAFTAGFTTFAVSENF